MVELLFEGWAQPQAASSATASQVPLRVDVGWVGGVIDTNLGSSVISANDYW